MNTFELQSFTHRIFTIFENKINNFGVGLMDSKCLCVCLLWCSFSVYVNLNRVIICIILIYCCQSFESRKFPNFAFQSFVSVTLKCCNWMVKFYLTIGKNTFSPFKVLHLHVIYFLRALYIKPNHIHVSLAFNKIK